MAPKVVYAKISSNIVMEVGLYLERLTVKGPINLFSALMPGKERK